MQATLRYNVMVMGLLTLAIMDPLLAAETLDDVFGKGETVTKSIGIALAGLSVLMGFIFTAMGIIGFTKQGSDPSGKSKWAFLIAGMFLMSLAAVILAVNSTLGIDDPMAPSSGVGAGRAGGNSILDNLTYHLGSSFGMIMMIAKVIGVFVFIMALSGLAKGSKEGSIKGTVYAGLILGALLVNIDGILNVLTTSFLGGASGLTSAGTFNYQDTANSAMDDKTKSYVQFALTVFAMFGFIGLISGLHGLSQDGQRGEGVGFNLVKIIGGTLAINLKQVLDIVAKSAGTTEENVFRNLLKLFGVVT